MKTLKIIANYLFYCGINKKDYNSIKKMAYVSNFRIWKIIHIFMSVAFSILFINSLFDDLLSANRMIYMIALIYSILSTVFFFIMKEDSLIAQFWIYLSISLLFLFGCFLTLNNIDHPSTTFIVMLLITPMFMLDKPYFMGIELTAASTVFLVWMHALKSPLIWKMDLVNVIAFSISGFVIHIIINSIRAREILLTREIKIKKDIDELTGLKNKSALTKKINDYLTGDNNNKGILFILDIDYFKSINDTYGHDVGDDVIHQFGVLLNDHFKNDEIVGRFGGDEFVFFVKGTNEESVASEIAKEVVTIVPNVIKLPDESKKVTASIGIALYQGEAKNYSELFKKADIALYDVKSKRTIQFEIYKDLA